MSFCCMSPIFSSSMFLGLGEHVPPMLVETLIKLSIHTQMKKKSIRERKDVAAPAIHKRGNEGKN